MDRFNKARKMGLLQETGANAALQLSGAAIGMGIDYLGSGWRNRTQLEQQRKLQELGIKGSKEMSDYQAEINKQTLNYSAELNKQMALDMWDATGPKQQAERLRKAGLNVGLMYGGAGGGGGATTAAPSANTSGASVSGGHAEMPSQMGMQLGMQTALQAAQIENIKANTEKTKTEAANIGEGGIDTQVKEKTRDNIWQETANKALENQIRQMDRNIKEVQMDNTLATQEEALKAIRDGYQKLAGEAEKAKNDGKISTETYEQNVKQIEQATAKQAAEILAIKEGTEFNYGSSADKVRWMNAAMGALKTVAGAGGAIH